MTEYLYQKLKYYAASGHYGFHMPGHKRNKSLTCAGLPYDIDITEIEGFDDLHHAEGILKQAEERAAKVFHAEETHYLINGSTAGILSSVLGSTKRGDKVAMARNCHKSVYNAVLMNELRPIYLYPQIRGDTGINAEITVREVERVLTEHPDIRVVVITSPTYDGIVSDVKNIAGAAHKKGAVLIVDEAHGAHFGFHPYFPKNGNQQGADIVIHSLHKTLPALTQTALMRMKGEITDRKRVRRYLHMLQSSSPSYVLMAGIDECVRVLEESGAELFDQYVPLLDKTRKRLEGLHSLELIETKDYDRSKILISTRKCENRKIFTGKKLYSILNKKYLLQMEMAASSYVIAMTSPADTAEGMERLASALEEIDRELTRCKRNERSNSCLQNYREDANEQIYPPSQAVEIAEKARGESIPLGDCTGRVALEYAYVYPPGIPLTVPGERVSAGTAGTFRRYEKAGLRIEGTGVPGMIEVLIERE